MATVDKLDIKESFFHELEDLVVRRTNSALHGQPYTQATWNAHARHQIHLIVLMFEGSLEAYEDSESQDPQQ